VYARWIELPEHGKIILAGRIRKGDSNGKGDFED
jgi:hypothetical protein